MPELRGAKPYISTLMVTKRITSRQVPTGRQFEQNGQRLIELTTVEDRPGIVAEIIPYLGLVAAPAVHIDFPSKQFFQDGLDNNKKIIEQLDALKAKVTEWEALKAKEERDVAEQNRYAVLSKEIVDEKNDREQLDKYVTDQVIPANEKIEAALADATQVWAEDLLPQGMKFIDLWADAFSDALDMFPTWSEIQDATGGIPVEVKELQWEARIPYESSKSIKLSIGLFNKGDENQSTKADLVFADEASKQQRLANIAQQQQAIVRTEEEIDQLPAGPSDRRRQLELQLAQQKETLARVQAEEVATMGELLALESVKSSLKTLLMAILVAAKAKFKWDDLNMTEVGTRLAAILTTLK